MLTVAQFDQLSGPIVDLYERYLQSVLNDIARRLAKLKLTDAAAWQLQRMIESGAVYENAIQELAKVTGASAEALKRAFVQAGVKSLRFDDAIYKAAGLQPLPLNLSPAMAQVLAAGLRKTGGMIQNLTMTTALNAQQAFVKAADLAYLQVSSGAFDYNTAIRAAVKNVAAQGLSSVDYLGRSDQLDVAMRRAVLTGVSQTAGQLQVQRADEMGSDLVAVSAHIGARNKGVGPMNHESWQGKVYSRSGTSRKYPNFYSVTGYGTGEGLGGWNCRHSFYPYFEGLSQNAYSAETRNDYQRKRVSYNGRQLSVYEATQVQRGYERAIRGWKRQAEALEAAGLDNAAEAAKVAEWQARMRDLVRQTGLDRQYLRERV